MRKFLVRILLFFLSVSPTIMAQSRDSLQNTLRQIASKADAQVGIAVIFHGTDTITVGNDDRYPLMSVFKFHQALAVIDYLKRNGLSLDSRVYIKKEDLLEDTHSPLRDRYPQGERWLSVGDLLTYTLQQSDNNACDILFRYIGGTEVADAYLRRIGREHFCISATEEQMNADPHTTTGPPRWKPPPCSNTSSRTLPIPSNKTDDGLSCKTCWSVLPGRTVLRLLWEKRKPSSDTKPVPAGGMPKDV